MKHFFRILFFLLTTLTGTEAQIPNAPPGGIPGQPTPPTTVVPNPNGSILDDTTKQIYGPNTTRFFLETDVFNNRKTLYPIDTALAGFHQYTFPQRVDHRLVDLGNLGTATRLTYYEPPTRMGAQPGFNAYDPYAFTPESIRYFDTKSPFSNIYYVQGGQGQNILAFDFSRNINSRLNLGLDLQRITSEKQFGLQNSRNQLDRQEVNSWAFALHGNYRSRNDKYTLLAHVRVLEQSIADLGGVSLDAGVDPDSILTGRLDAVLARTPFARTRERRNNFHTYQQFALANGFQVYHILDVEGRYNRYTDVNYASSNPRAYPSTGQRAEFDTLAAETSYSLLENRVGVKGFFSGFNYRLHLRRRDYRWLNQYGTYLKRDSITSPATSPAFFVADGLRTGEVSFLRRSETFLGVWLNYYFPDSSRVWAEGEYLLGKDYLLRGEYQTRWLQVGLSSTFLSPTLVQQRFLSPLLSWENRFSNVAAQSVWGRATFRVGGLTLRPSVSYDLIKDYIFYEATGAPQQTAVPLNLFRAGLGLEFRLGIFSTRSELQLATTSGADVLRVPKVMANSRLALDVLFKKVLYIQMGLELHYKSGYYANAYLPLTGQFYLQNQFRNQPFLLADAFANLRINRVRLFLKFANLNQGLFGNGFYPTPYYPGLRRAFGFGVSWLLFD